MLPLRLFILFLLILWTGDGLAGQVQEIELTDGQTEERVSDALGPYAGVNPPPNNGAVFEPPFNPALPAPPVSALILKQELATGVWTDDNDVAWPVALVPWNLHDHDLAVIDAATLGVTYVSGLMNLNMHISVRPDGRIVIVGTDATNHIRFEPNLTGTFVRSKIALVDPIDRTRRKVIPEPPNPAARSRAWHVGVEGGHQADLFAA